MRSYPKFLDGAQEARLATHHFEAVAPHRCICVHHGSPASTPGCPHPVPAKRVRRFGLPPVPARARRLLDANRCPHGARRRAGSYRRPSHAPPGVGEISDRIPVAQRQSSLKTISLEARLSERERSVFSTPGERRPEPFFNQCSNARVLVRRRAPRFPKQLV